MKITRQQKPPLSKRRRPWGNRHPGSKCGAPGDQYGRATAIHAPKPRAASKIPANLERVSKRARAKHQGIKPAISATPEYPGLISTVRASGDNHWLPGLYARTSMLNTLVIGTPTWKRTGPVSEYVRRNCPEPQPETSTIQRPIGQAAERQFLPGIPAVLNMDFAAYKAL